jgi:hypothetical protein
MSFLFASSGERKPESAVILQFPRRGRFDVCVEREEGGVAWLVRTHDRGHGWLHGDFSTAVSDARELARPLGVAVRSSAIVP